MRPALTSVSFTVLGTPAPQGSIVRTKWGVREDNPNTKPWRQAVAAAAQHSMTWEYTALPFPTGPVEVSTTLFFPRPKSHYGTGKNAGNLKSSAPRWHETTPDADKLARALGDAMAGIVFRNDSQIAKWTIRKYYGEPARADITVRSLDTLAALDTNTAAA